MYKHFFKRSIDFTISLIALISIGWFLAIVSIWLHFANKGAGAFFLQERPGMDSKIFKVIKFKSMTDERDDKGNLLPNDKRITPIGKFIRNTSIDELPQLINVLKGDMSLIGPRPLLIEYLPYYTLQEKKRHNVRPGITGLAQINGRNNLNWEKRLSMDVEYVDKISFTLDLQILYMTIIKVLKQSDVKTTLDPKINVPLNIYRKKC